MTTFVFDTNIVSWLMVHDPAVIARMNQRVTAQDSVLGCPMVWYEVLRGLRARDARSKTERFRQLFATFEWKDFVQQDWDLAATRWASRRGQGKPISDSDLLIAVFTINRNAILVTDNTKDFSDINVNIENWR